jgi:protein gp37
MGQASYKGLTTKVKGKAVWTGKIAVNEKLLVAPLTWRNPRRIFVNSMSDLFADGVSDATIDRVFAVMALAPQHTFLEIRGRLAVNRVFKTESFAADLEIVQAETSIRLRPLASVNRRGAEKIPLGDRLSPAAIAALRRVYWRDFTLFGYY